MIKLMNYLNLIHSPHIRIIASSRDHQRPALKLLPSLYFPFFSSFLQFSSEVYLTHKENFSFDVEVSRLIRRAKCRWEFQGVGLRSSEENRENVFLKKRKTKETKKTKSNSSKHCHLKDPRTPSQLLQISRFLPLPGTASPRPQREGAALPTLITKQVERREKFKNLHKTSMLLFFPRFVLLRTKRNTKIRQKRWNHDQHTNETWKLITSLVSQRTSRSRNKHIIGCKYKETCVQDMFSTIMLTNYES